MKRMRRIIFPLILISIFGCSNKLDNWITFKDPFNIGSISMPTYPSEKRDTIITPKFKLVSSIHMSSVDNEVNSPSAFNYDLYFPTDLNEFDLFLMKKDSNTVNRLFENMINGAKNKSNSEVIEKSYFNHPEPGVKITLLNSQTNNIGICRIIIFDNYVVATSAVGTKDNYSNEIEDKFFNTLKINPENRNRK